MLEDDKVKKVKVINPVESVAVGSVPITAPLSFKVKLQRKPGAEPVTLFSFIDGDRLDHFATVGGDEFEKEFDDLSKAQGFIAGALETGGFIVADDSQVKPARS